MIPGAAGRDGARPLAGVMPGDSARADAPCMRASAQTRGLSLVLAFALVSLLTAAVASADRTQIRPADQASAERDLLKRSDLSASVHWVGGKVTVNDGQLSCSDYRPSGSGLVETGAAGDKFSSTGITISDQVEILASARMVATDARRTFTGAVVPCLRSSLAHALGAHGAVPSVSEIAFRRLAEYVHAYRVLYDIKARGKSFPVILDIICVGAARTEMTLTVNANLPSDLQSGESDVSHLDLLATELLVQRAFPVSGPLSA